MKYVIMCGGKYPAWQTPRQLSKIAGEPNVARTIRLLQEAGVRVEDIRISAEDVRFTEFGVQVLTHKNDFVANSVAEGFWVNAFIPSRDPMCYLMGDVVFSPEAIKTIVGAKTDDILFFASAPPFSKDYIKPWAEPFAFKVVNQRRFREAIDYIKKTLISGIYRRHPIAWELWAVIRKQDDPNFIDYGSYSVINDYTCDIDSQEDAVVMDGVVRRCQKRNT